MKNYTLGWEKLGIDYEKLHFRLGKVRNRLSVYS